ncbi:MAG: site-2 protease family protein [Candidatus Altiarchaeota archaeon]
MRSSLTLFEVFGISVKLHISFIVLLLVVTFFEGLTTLFYFSLIFLFVLGHELSHSLVAKMNGIPVKEIVLTFIGGIASIEIPENPRLELKVSVAGPVFNLMVVTFALVTLTFFYPTWAGSISAQALRENPLSPMNLLLNIIAINLMLGFFNLLPGFPMDGGRILRSILAFWFDYVKATELAVNTGRYIVFPFMVIWGLVSGNLILVAIAGILYLVSGAELQMLLLRNSFRGVSVFEAADKSFTYVLESLSIREFLDSGANPAKRYYLVISDEGLLRGYFFLRDLEGLNGSNAQQPVACLARDDYKVLKKDGPVSYLFRKGLLNKPIIVVSEGEVLGVLTRDYLLDNLRYFQSRKITGKNL